MASASINRELQEQVGTLIGRISTAILVAGTEPVTGSLLDQCKQAFHELSSICSGPVWGNAMSALSSALSDRDSAGAIRVSSVQSALAALQMQLDGSESSQVGAPEVGTDADIAQDPELIADFVAEAREHLEKVEAGVLVLEEDPHNSETLNAVFRSFHSIKGVAGFLELHRIQEFAHEVETLLDAARNGELTVDPSAIDLILACADFLKQCVDALEAGTFASVPSDDVLLIAKLKQAKAQGSEDHAVAVSEPPAIVFEEPQGPEPVADANSPEPEPIVAKAPVPSVSREAFSVRVDTSKLDYLMDMIGEMVIAESLIQSELAEHTNTSASIHRKFAQLARVTGEVQRTAMGLRMVPIGQVFGRMTRIIRDLCRKFDKSVKLETRGDDIELDKSIAEELVDPLMHMIRNSMDHGVEDRATRLEQGKHAVATVRLSASHQGGQVVVEVSDDGRGINREKVLAAARSKGIAVSNNWSDEEVFNLIFHPGFSTAERVTGVSGRGVGMDVVRKQVEKLSGQVDVRSVQGKGTTFILKLPLTRAIIDGLIVSVGDHRYVVPLSTVREMLRPSPECISTVTGKGEMARVHERLLPIVRLHRVFSLDPRHVDPCEAVLIVIEAEGRSFCLMVDELIGNQEVVIKNLGQLLRGTRGISGGTILGDGRVGLILDVHQVGGVTSNA